ncbi:MAG: CARDB domain-containing protein, partial [Fibrobacterota bacterium]
SSRRNVLLKLTSDNGLILYTTISLYITASGQPPFPDLSITTSDINLSNYTINGSGTLDITVHNSGTAEATNVPVSVYRFNNLVSAEQLTSIAPGATQTIQVTIPVVTSGEHLINVFIDSSNTIQELDKSNNEANKIIKVGGQTVQSGGILVTATLPDTVYTNALFKINGSTIYDIIVDGVRHLDFPVKGCAITLTVSDNAGHSWVYNGGHSTTNGNFSKVVQAPSTAGVYTATITATDQTFSGSRTVSFTVVDRPAQPAQPPKPHLPPYDIGAGNWIWYPGGTDIWDGHWEWIWDVLPSTPVPQQDVSVYSENIHFSKNNPAQNEKVTIFTEFNYWATSTVLDALNVPVNFYVTRPGSEKIKIGSSIIDKISVSAPEKGSRFVYVDWENNSDGVYIVEAEVAPIYTESNLKNNAATRAIIVGEYAANHGILSGQVTGPEGGMKNIGIELYDNYGISGTRLPLITDSI